MMLQAEHRQGYGQDHVHQIIHQQQIPECLAINQPRPALVIILYIDVFCLIGLVLPSLSGTAAKLSVRPRRLILNT